MQPRDEPQRWTTDQASAIETITVALDALPTDEDRTIVAQHVLAIRGAQARQAGWEAKKAAGGYIGGRPPIGYRAQSGDLVADAREQAIVVRILELRRAGCSLRAIAETLTDEGRRNRAGTVSWHPETISRICRQPGEHLDVAKPTNGHGWIVS